MTRLALTPSKPRFALYLAAGVLGLATGCALLFVTDKPLPALGVIALSLWSLWSYGRVLRAGPQIVIDENGVHDWTLGVGVVSWSDITDVHLRRGKGGPFLCIKVRDPDMYIDRLPAHKRARHRLERALGRDELSVTLQGLTGAKPDDVVLAILAGSRSAQGAT